MPWHGGNRWTDVFFLAPAMTWVGGGERCHATVVFYWLILRAEPRAPRRLYAHAARLHRLWRTLVAPSPHDTDLNRMLHLRW